MSNDALIQQGLDAGLGSEIVKTWPQLEGERDLSEAHLVDRLFNLSARMDTFERSLADNTAATQRIETSTAAIVEAFASLKGAMNVLETIGRLARPLSYIAMASSGIVALFYAIKGGGKS
jgi:hypothetical protein